MANDKAQFEYAAAKAEKLLPDAEFDRIYDLSADEVAALPDDIRKKFYATLKWHNQDRLSLNSAEGIVVGGKTIDEITKG